MRLTVSALGRARGGPEAALTADWLDRATRSGRPLGLGPCRLVEIDERKARSPDDQAAKLIETLPAGARAVVLDERGRQMSSRAFADEIARLRDSGVPETVFLIGGADGHGQAARDRADLLLGFGPMVWPHMLVRAMLAEQIYRAVSLLAGSPYHRD